MNNLETLMKCPVCQKKYLAQSASMVRKSDRFMLVYVRCENCGMGSLAIVSKNVFSQGGVLMMGILTDLERDEVDFFSKAKPISWDEVLNFHQKEFLVEKNYKS